MCMQGVIKNNPVHGLTPAISYATLKMQTYCLYGRVNFCQICALPPSSTMNQVCCSARQNERKNTNINHSVHSNSSPHTLKGSLVFVAICQLCLLRSDVKAQSHWSRWPWRISNRGSSPSASVWRAAQIEGLGAAINIPDVSGIEFSL